MKIKIELLPKVGFVRADLLMKVLEIDKSNALSVMAVNKIIPKPIIIDGKSIWRAEPLIKAIKKIKRNKIYYHHHGHNKRFIEDCKQIILEISALKKEFTSSDLINLLEEKHNLFFTGRTIKNSKITKLLRSLEESKFIKSDAIIKKGVEDAHLIWRLKAKSKAK